MKTTRVQLLTPFGRAGFCSLGRPNFKFQTEAGEFSARVILTPEAAAPIIAQLDELYEQAYQTNLAEVQKDKPKITEIKRADKPYKNVEDPDTGEKLPDIQINARLKFKVIGKNEAGQKEVFRTQRPLVVDAKKNPIRTEIGAGSIIRISFMAGSFYTPTLGSGLSLKLVGVQVQKLVGLGMADPNFDEVEGYEEPTTASSPVEVIHAPTPGAEQENTSGQSDADNADY